MTTGQRVGAYYRASTDKGRSGPGLEAQRKAVRDSVVATAGQLAAEFTEIESGERDDPLQFAAALAACRKQKAVLCIAKLDRLARNVAFIANLMDAGVDFVAVDMPNANRLTLHVMAALAEHEREAHIDPDQGGVGRGQGAGRLLGRAGPDQGWRDRPRPPARGRRPLRLEGASNR